MQTIHDLLNWLTAEGGALILIAWATSWALEGWTVWENLPSKSKSLAILVVACLLGVFAVWMQSQPRLVEAIAPFARVVIAIVGMWLTTQTAHRLNPLRK
jgi:hypothetical protein